MLAISAISVTQLQIQVEPMLSEEGEATVLEQHGWPQTDAWPAAGAGATIGAFAVCGLGIVMFPT